MRAPKSYLSKREQQILEILFREGPSSANDILERLPDAPSNSTVRKLLAILEERGHVKHKEVDGKFLYSSVQNREQAGVKAALNVVETFFAGSMSQTFAALLTGGAKLSNEELAYVEQLIRKAKEEGQ